MKWRAVREEAEMTLIPKKKGVENNRSNLVLKPIIRTFNEENHL